MPQAGRSLLQGFIRAVNVETGYPLQGGPNYLVTETEIVELFGRFARGADQGSRTAHIGSLHPDAPSVHPGEGLDDEILAGHVNRWRWCRPSAGPPRWICQLH